jgi:hypothetical protein
MIAATREHLGWVLHDSGPESADHTVLLLPGALCTAAFYDDLLAEPSMREAPIPSSLRRCPVSAGPLLSRT